MFQVHPYKVPSWAANLNGIPASYVKFSEFNTPIHRWDIPDVPSDFRVYIKRDDLTGTELSGNKVRNLQLSFADALSKGCRHVVTVGSKKSGHARAVALMARSLGMTPHILVVHAGEKAEDLGSEGNTLLYRMAGSHIYLSPDEVLKNQNHYIGKMAEYIRYKEPCYRIPIGGATSTGLFGFLSMFQELMDQGLHERFDDVVVAAGSGLTAAGLAIGNYLTGSKVRIHAVSILYAEEDLIVLIDGLLQQVGLATVRTRDILDIITDHIVEGYLEASDQVLEYIIRVSTTTGILLDPNFTGTCAYGLMTDLKYNPSRFNGKRILFMHTGGIFGLFSGEMDRVLNKDGAVTNIIRSWPDVDTSPI